MNFESVIKHVADFKKVRRSIWRKGVYLEITNGTVDLFTPEDEEGTSLVLSRKDILADDWEIVD